MSQTDRPLLGILMVLLFCVVAPFTDSLAKILGERMTVGQILFVRFAVQAVMLLPFLAAAGAAYHFSRKIWLLMWARTVLHLLGVGLMFTALQYLPLADAIAIAFVMPFILLILGHFVLGEVVGWRRSLACLVGFLGCLMVIQPSFSKVGWPALYPLGVAIDFALFIMVTRQLAKSCEPIRLQAISGLMAMAILAVLLLAGAWRLPVFQFQWPQGWEFAMLGMIGVLGTGAHLLLTLSLRYAPASTLAPMQYLEIPFATLLGMIIFKEWPNALAGAGIAVTLLSGLYVVYRENKIARFQSPAPP